MKNFIFKSTDADLQKMFHYLETLQKNVLYCTHQLDFIRRKIISLEVNKDTQKQVDEYFAEADRAYDPEDKQDID